MGAVVQINAVSTRVKDVPFGVAVSLLNASLGGVTSQKWEVVAYSQDIYGNEPDPANYSGWTLTGKIFSRTQSGTYPAVTFTPDISGNYIIRLTDTTNVDPLLWTIQTAVVRVKDQLSGGYIPAPGENDEVDTDRGWSLERNQDLRIQARFAAYGGHMRVVNLTGSTIARGKICKVIGFTDMHTVGGSAVPGGSTVRRERIAKVQVANSSDSDATNAVYVLVTEPAGLLNNGTSYALRNGMFEGVNPSTGGVSVNFSGFTVAALVYLNTTGDIVSAPAGSNTVAIGRCIENGSDGDMLFDGSFSRSFTSKFIVQGTVDSQLPNAQFLGALGTGLVKNTTTTGVLSIAASGTDYEVPLTFSTPGNTRTGNNVTADYITGKAGNQQWYGGFASGDGLTIDANFNATKGPLRLNAARMGFNRVAGSSNMYDFDLTQTFNQDDTTTLDAFFIRGSTVTFNEDININSATRVAYVSIGQPTFLNAFDNDIGPTPDGISTLWIEGEPICDGWDDEENKWAVYVKSGDVRAASGNVWVGGFSGVQLDRNGNQAIQKLIGGSLSVVNLVPSQPLNFGVSGNTLAVRITTPSGNVGLSVAPGAANRLRVNSSQTVASGASATLDSVYFDPSTITITGVTTIATALGFNQHTFAAPVLNGAVTIGVAATVAISGAPSGTATITQPLSLWVQAGNVRIASLNGLLKGTTGIVGVATAGTDYSLPIAAADTTVIFPTATTVRVNLLPSKFVVQGTTDTMLPNAQFLGALGTGLVKNTTTTGVLSIAAAGTDFESPLTFNSGLTRATNTVTNDLFTGKGAGQSVVGATSNGGFLTLSSSSGTKGLINFGASNYDELGNVLNVIGSSTSQNTPVVTVQSTSASGVAPIHFKINGVLRGGLRGDSSGSMTWFAQGANHYFLTGGEFGVGSIKAKIFANGNFLVSDPGVSFDATDSGAQFGTSGTSSGSQVTRFATNPASIVAASGAALDAHSWDNVLISLTGSTTITNAAGFNFAIFNAPSLLGASPVTVTHAGTLVVSGPPNPGPNITITNGYAFWVRSGTTKLAGTVIAGSLNGMLKGVSGTLTVATGGTDFALPSVNIIAGTGLTGGGTIATDVTLNVIANADNSIVVNANDIQVGVINDTQHGNRGNGALHTVATTSVNGFFAATDKSTLANSKFFVGNSTNAPASAQNLGALASGMLKHTVSTGTSTIAVAVSGTDFELPLTFSTGLTRATQTITVDLSTGKGTGQSVYGGLTSGDLTLHSNTSSNGKIFFSSSNNGFNESTGNFWLGLSSPISSALVHINRDSNAINELFNTNPNTGGAAGSAFILGLDITSDTTKYLQMKMFGTSFTTSGLISAQAGIIEHKPSNGAPFLLSQAGTGDVVWTTTSSVTERMRLFNNGHFQIGSVATDQAAQFSLTGTSTTAQVMRLKTTPATLTASTSLVLNAYSWDPVTVTLSGGTNVDTSSGLNLISINSPNYTNSSAMTVKNAATLAITGAPGGGGSLSITNRYAFWVQNNLSRFDGNFASPWFVIFEVPDQTSPAELGTPFKTLPVKVVGDSTVYHILLYTDAG